MKTSVSVEEDGPGRFAPMTGALAAKSLNPMRPRERRIGLSRRCYAGLPEVLTLTTGASAEEGESEDSTAMTGALAAEVEGVMRPSIMG